MSHNDPVLQPFRVAVNCFKQLPVGDELEFLEKTCQTFSEKLTSVNQLVKTCLEQVVSLNTTCNWQNSETDLETIFENTQEAIESFLEQADECVDIFKGLKKTSEEDPFSSSTLCETRRKRWRHLDIPKPQEGFPDYPINNESVPTEDTVDVVGSTEFFSSQNGDLSTLDNHLLELHQQNRKQNHDQLQSNYQKLFEELKQNADAFQGSSMVTLFLPLEDSSCTFVNSLTLLEDMITKLEREKEIAVDIENHSYRSFQGFICLLQFSTRQEDFVVDAIALRGHLKLLSRILENRNILKVLHGANSDVQWLQRDFGLRIIHMFDTGQASRQLKFPFLSLSYLLKHYCNIDNSKTKKYYQLADWRIRPLPKDMFAYARQDTHYLLYIYDRICEDLRNSSANNNNNNLLSNAYRASIQVSMLTYEKPQMNPLEYQSILTRRKLHFNEKQTLVLRALCGWRDQVARMEDESPVYVLPEKCMIEIARRIPQSDTELCDCCPYLVPPLLNKYMNEVLKLLQQSVIEESEWSNSKLESEACCPNEQVIKRTPNNMFERIQSSRIAPISISSNGSLFGSNVFIENERIDSFAKTRVEEIRQEMMREIASRFRGNVKSFESSGEILPEADNEHKKEEEQLEQQTEENVMILVPQGSSSNKRRKKRVKEKREEENPAGSLAKKLNLSSFFEKLSNAPMNDIASTQVNGDQSTVDEERKGKNRNGSFSNVRLKQGNRSATF